MMGSKCLSKPVQSTYRSVYSTPVDAVHPTRPFSGASFAYRRMHSVIIGKGLPKTLTLVHFLVQNYDFCCWLLVQFLCTVAVLVTSFWLHTVSDYWRLNLLFNMTVFGLEFCYATLYRVWKFCRYVGLYRHNMQTVSTDRQINKTKQIYNLFGNVKMSRL